MDHNLPKPQGGFPVAFCKWQEVHTADSQANNKPVAPSDGHGATLNLVNQGKGRLFGFPVWPRIATRYYGTSLAVDLIIARHHDLLMRTVRPPGTSPSPALSKPILNLEATQTSLLTQAAELDHHRVPTTETPTSSWLVDQCTMHGKFSDPKLYKISFTQTSNH